MVADQHVVAGAAVEHVRAGTEPDMVGELVQRQAHAGNRRGIDHRRRERQLMIADQDVVAVAAEERVVPARSIEIPDQAVDLQRASPGAVLEAHAGDAQPVIADQAVVSGAAVERVVAGVEVEVAGERFDPHAHAVGGLRARNDHRRVQGLVADQVVVTVVAR